MKPPRPVRIDFPFAASNLVLLSNEQSLLFTVQFSKVADNMKK